MSKAHWKIISTPSPSQVQANRANAQSSTGPRTDKGKAVSSRNALSHGLTSKRLVLDSEDGEAYTAFHDDLQKCWAPVGDREQAAFTEYVNSLWRLQRCRRTEPAVLDDCVKSLTQDDPKLTPDQALARIFTDPIYQKKMSLFLRYQSAIERAVNRALRELTQLQADRREFEMMARMNQRVNVAAPSPIAASDSPSDLYLPNGFVSQLERSHAAGAAVGQAAYHE